jgi:hypothetical protein
LFNQLLFALPAAAELLTMCIAWPMSSIFLVLIPASNQGFISVRLQHACKQCHEMRPLLHCNSCRA